jgi:hypothetical protein
MADHADRRNADLFIDPLGFTIDGDGNVSYWGWLIVRGQLSVVSCP